MEYKKDKISTMSTNGDKDIYELLLHYATDTLTPEERHLLDVWLAESPNHRKEMERLMSDDKAFDHLQLYEGIDKDRAWAEFRASHFKHTAHLAWFHALEAAAAVAVLIVVLVLALQKPDKEVAKVIRPHFTNQEETIIGQSVASNRTAAVLTTTGGRKMTLTAAIQKQMAEGKPMPAEFFSGDAEVSTLEGKEYWIPLEDGTRVHLNYNTTLKYPAHFEDDNRTVSVSGEAYFIVSHETNRPFYVRTPHGTVKEYGTQFNVNTRKGGTTEVALVEGKISLLTGGNTEYAMRPGQVARIGQGVSLSNDDIAQVVSWNSGRYVFDGCSLSKLADVLSSWYDVRIKFANEAVKSTLFSGSIDRYKSLDVTLDAITFVTGCSVTKEGNTIIFK